MGKQKKQLLVAGILLILVAAAYIGMKYYNSQPKEEEVTSYTVTQDAADAVTKFSFTNENGSFSFEKADDVWICKEAPDMKVDETVLMGMIETAVAAVSENQIENVADMAQYGLEEPEITVYYETAENNQTIKLGDYNASLYLFYERSRKLYKSHISALFLLFFFLVHLMFLCIF